MDNSKALNEFLESVERRAYRIAEIATGHREDALDIVQDAMLKLVEKYADRSPQDWGPLFYRILQSRIRDRYRRNSVRQRVFGLFGGTRERDESASEIESYPDRQSGRPDHKAQSRQMIDQLEPALRALPRRQQQVFLLRMWEGLDVRQTARAMSCSEGSVKTHYSRALRALRAKLDAPHGVQDGA